MTIELTRDEAKQLLEADSNCFNEGQHGPPERILREIARVYPDLMKEYDYLPWARGVRA